MTEPLDPTTDLPAPVKVETPIAVDPTPAKAIGGTFLGALLIVATSFPALLTILSARDLNALRAWMASFDGATFLASASFVGAVVWRITAGARKHLKLIVAARSARNRVAYVKGDPDSPA